MKGPPLSPDTPSDSQGLDANPCATELDARASTPPIHLDAILAALSSIPPGALQFVRTRKQPAELVRSLARHGISADSSELSDGSWRTMLSRVHLAPSR